MIYDVQSQAETCGENCTKIQEKKTNKYNENCTNDVRKDGIKKKGIKIQKKRL